jgi:hypothetical protein
MNRASALVLLATATTLLAACGSPSTEPPPAGHQATVESFPRPAALANLPLVELIGPAPTAAGPAPVFEWRSVDGAATYRLSVRGPDFRNWAWAGSGTSVRYGGVTDGQAGPTIIPGTVWSVAALGADGSILALSGLRPVSPTDDPGPAPDWIDAAAAAAAPADDVSTPPPAGPFDACDLLTADEIRASIDGAWGAPESSNYGGDSGRCEWTSGNGSILSIEVMPADAYDPDGWGADGTIDGLGEKSYVVSHGWDRRIGFVRGGRSVMLVIDWTRVDLQAFEGIARQIASRLP